MKRLALVLVLLVALFSLSSEAATLSRQNIGAAAAALEPSYANAGGAGDLVPNSDNRTVLLVKNPGAGAATVTVAAQVTSATIAGLGVVTIPDVVATLAAGEAAVIGPLPSSYNTSAGMLSLSYGGASAADVDVAALKLPTSY